MKSIVTWLWNDDATAQEPDPAPPPPPKPRANLPALTSGKKETWRDRAAKRRAGIYPQRPPRPQPTSRHRGPPREFHPENVNTQARAFKKHLHEPHRYICVADSSEGLDPKYVEWLKTPDEARAFAHLRSPEGQRFPSCYRRLWNFSDAARVLGGRIMAIDIDAIPVADIGPLFAQKDDFVGWVPERAWGQQHRFGGGTYLLTPGTKTAVWTKFSASAAATARAAGYRGSDQAWMSYMLAKTEPFFPRNSGIHSVREMGHDLNLPKGARIVHFNGPRKPWQYGHIGWIAEHWRNV